MKFIAFTYFVLYQRPTVLSFSRLNNKNFWLLSLLIQIHSFEKRYEQEKETKTEEDIIGYSRKDALHSCFQERNVVDIYPHLLIISNIGLHLVLPTTLIYSIIA